jgi:hypothetical protein
MSNVQKTSTFRPCTPNESEAGDGDYFDAYSSHQANQKIVRNKETNLALFFPLDSTEPTTSILLSPSQSLTPGGNYEENRLFHHYICHVSVLIPIDCVRNPWKSTYPSIAVQN